MGSLVAAIKASDDFDGSAILDMEVMIRGTCGGWFEKDLRGKMLEEAAFS